MVRKLVFLEKGGKNATILKAFMAKVLRGKIISVVNRNGTIELVEKLEKQGGRTYF